MDNSVTHASTMIGTQVYDAPELLQNDPYSYPLDVWSLGVVVTEMCTFKHPFGTSMVDIMDNIRYNPPTPLPQLPDNTAASIAFISSLIIKPKYAGIVL